MSKMFVFDPAHLRAARVAAGMSLSQAGKRVNRSKTSIMRGERGEVDVAASMVADLANAYGVDPRLFYVDSPVRRARSQTEF